MTNNEQSKTKPYKATGTKPCKATRTSYNLSEYNNLPEYNNVYEYSMKKKEPLKPSRSYNIPIKIKVQNKSSSEFDTYQMTMLNHTVNKYYMNNKYVGCLETQKWIDDKDIIRKKINFYHPSENKNKINCTLNIKISYKNRGKYERNIVFFENGDLQTRM